MSYIDKIQALIKEQKITDKKELMIDYTVLSIGGIMADDQEGASEIMALISTNIDGPAGLLKLVRSGVDGHIAYFAALKVLVDDLADSGDLAFYNLNEDWRDDVNYEDEDRLMDRGCR